MPISQRLLYLQEKKQKPLRYRHIFKTAFLRKMYITF